MSSSVTTKFEASGDGDVHPDQVDPCSKSGLLGLLVGRLLLRTGRRESKQN
jgi:hypothetical protein